MRIAMKYITILMMIAFIFIGTANACDIKVSIYSEKKESYKPGDEITLLVNVHLTHRRCPEGIEATQFKESGLKILAGTKWVEESKGNFSMKLKVKVTGAVGEKAKLQVLRECNKEGGEAVFKISIN